MIKAILLTLFVVVDAFMMYVILGQAPTRWKANKAKMTPDERFDNLPDYPFKPNYKDVLRYQAMEFFLACSVPNLQFDSLSV